jgi:hypothetical protein
MRNLRIYAIYRLIGDNYELVDYDPSRDSARRSALIWRKHYGYKTKVTAIDVINYTEKRA